MHPSWLSAFSALPQWADLPTPEFSSERLKVAVLPIFGVADHGTGQCLDAEEILGSALLEAALAPPSPGVLVLPPYRHGPAPYRHTYFGVSLENTHAQLLSLAAGVRQTGATHLILWVTSPWQEEWIGACAVDIREATGLVTHVISQRALGLDWHPASPDRGASAAVATWLGAGEALTSLALAAGRSILFRPGHFPHSALPPAPPSEKPELRFQAAVHRLRAWLAEIHACLARPDGPALEPARQSLHFAAGYRSRYLPGLTAEKWRSLQPHKSLVVIPTGAIEQHGPHLPVGVDAVLGQAFLAAAHAHLPLQAPIWVTPPLTYGRSNEHRRFAGTLTLDTLTFQRALSDYIIGLHAQGFRRFAVLNTHGGNTAVLLPTLRRLQVERALQIGVLGGLFKPSLAPEEAAFGFHAGEWETSLCLALIPSLVRRDQAVREWPEALRPTQPYAAGQGVPSLAWLTEDLSRSGVMGDATAASPERGRLWLEQTGRSLAQRLLDTLGD